MPRWLLALLALWIPVGGAGGLWYTSDAQVMRREFNAVNLRLNDATASKNIPALMQFLKDALDEKATISLKVEHTMLGMKSNSVMLSQDFNKADFIRFMELTLEPMESYTLQTRIEELTPNEDGTVRTSTYGAGNGKAPEYMQGARVPMQYDVQTRCIMVARQANPPLQFTQMKCDVGLGKRAESMAPAAVQDLMNRATGVTP
jgi:hypothetical protein